MKVSLNWAKRFGGQGLEGSVDQLAGKIGGQLGGIEEIIDVGSKYGTAVIVRVISCEDHPGADRLHVCKVDDGRTVPNIERDDNGHVQIVCGAPNVRAGMLAVWLPPGSRVPSTVGKDDPFVLEVREIRGQKSHGMLASPRELGIGDCHEGILEVDTDVQPGDSFAQTYRLAGDYVLDIENKMFTHRPDCFGVLGVAREIAGIYQRRFTAPEWYRLQPDFPSVETEELRLVIKNEVPELVPRFTAITMRDVKVEPSPVWLQTYLARVGLRPINNIVDYTNYFMLVTGQPLHAYDYDKVKAQDEGAEHATIVVRKPKPAEKVLLLNGKEIEPRTGAIMIATEQRAIGIGGVMGGGNTEVDESTRNIIIECASFDMYSIRRTSMAHGLFTDAVTRFTKGQSPLQNLAVLAKITNEIREHTGGKLASAVIDDNHLPTEMLERGSLHPPVKITPDFINVRLGLKLSADEVKQLLENVEFKVTVESRETSQFSDLNSQILTVAAPFWRTDIEVPEDIVEEVGRLYGYDYLPLELPKRDIYPASKDPILELKSHIRYSLSRAGANEVLTYSFVHGNLFDKVGQDKAHAFQIANALSPDLQYYRLSLTPSLLEKIHPNIKAGYGKFALFEIGKTHFRDEMDETEPQVPNEDTHFALVLAYSEKYQEAGAPYYYARRYFTQVAGVQRLELSPLADFDLSQDEWGRQLTAPYDPARSAIVVRDGQIWGVVGEFKTSIRKALKLPAFVAGFEVHCDALSTTRPEYMPLPRFPKVEQDICLKVAVDLPYQKLAEFVTDKFIELKPENSHQAVTTIDIYQRDGDRDHKQITFRLSVASYECTLTDAEVAKLLDGIAEAAKDRFSAERI